MYAVCPPEFQRIGNECYFISREKETWMEAHFKCVDRDSKLAEPFKFEDKRLRKYLLTHGNQIGERSKRRRRRSPILTYSHSFWLSLYRAVFQVDRRHLQLAEQTVALGTEWQKYDVQGI